MENIYKNVQRITKDISAGLTNDLVKLRVSQGLLNIDTFIKSLSSADIVKKNLLTLFNLINVILALALIYTGSYKNLMFMGVVICNSIIGIIQEIRAKKIIDNLNLISSKKVTVIRENTEAIISPNEVTLDDIIKYSSGDQVIADCSVVSGFCEVDESLLTGESDPVSKQKGDDLLSGSFISGGSCYVRVERVGKDNYVSQILQGAKYVKKINSEIMKFLRSLIKFISIAIIPIGILLFSNQLKISDYNLNLAITATAAALIGMIPEGLVLLTSTALALGVIHLSKRNVLVQDIYCIETLARVDTLCLDKTGTITEGRLNVTNLIPQNGFTEYEVSQALSMLIGVLNDTNDTFMALKNRFYDQSLSFNAEKIVPFSSSRKWSGAFIKDNGLYIIGASEFIFKDNPEIINLSKKYSKNNRVLVLARSDDNISENNLPKNLKLMSLILLKDQIRSNAKETLAFFSNNGVNIKVISGDNPITVSNIAKQAGINNADNYIDMSTIGDNLDFIDISEKYTVFGRVTPEQKRSLISALKTQGHTVAMTGDGVNDILALKESDCSIAMATGSEAARTISHITLLDSNFSSLPQIVAEGRRVINNIQRTSALFLTKTIYSCVFAILFLFISSPYPFIPIQMTLISALTIGIPSLILSLEPNNERVKGSFFNNILNNSLPFALIIIFNIVISTIIYTNLDLSYEQYSTVAVLLTGIIEIILLYKISLPLNVHRKYLVISILILFITATVFFKEIFSLFCLNLPSIFIFCILLSLDLIGLKLFLFKNML